LPNNHELIQRQLNSAQVEHKDLDEIIRQLGQEGYADQLLLNRLKKRKLLLKDRIEKLESKLIPDLNA
jgi:hypothetical protein